MEKVTDIPIPDDAEVEIIIVNGQKYVRIIEPSRIARRPRSPSPKRRPRSPARRRVIQRTLRVGSNGPLREVADQINEHLGSNIEIIDDNYGIIEISDAEAANSLHNSSFLYTASNGRRIHVAYSLL